MTRGRNAGVSTVAVAKLVQYAAAVNSRAPALIRDFVQLEVDRVSELLRGLAANEATYDGEDQDWLLNLTRCVQVSIDAVSLPEVDSAENSFWASPLGVRYLDTQRRAITRGVRVRRVFVTTHDDVANDPILRTICQAQVDSGIEVRLLYASSVPSEIRGQLTDFILFDDEVCYETVPVPHVDRGAAPMILFNHLELRAHRLLDRSRCYRIIWESARPWSDLGRDQSSSLRSGQV